MDSSEKRALAMTGRSDSEAAGLRVCAARLFAGLSKAELAESIGRGRTLVANIERGLSFPSRELMLFFYQEHRLDFNYFIVGDYAQLPAGVLDRLFDCLADAKQDVAQKGN